MRIHLNEEAVNQLTSIMARTGYTNPTHTIHVMLSTILNNLRRADREKQNAASS